MLNVIIADDHKLVREGLRAMIASFPNQVKVVGEAANGKQLLELLENTDSQLVLLDLDMPEMDGLEAAQHIQHQFPHIKLLVLSMLESEEYIAQALGAGAQGYLLKSAGVKELIWAMKMVADGERYIDSQVTLNLLEKLPSLKKSATLSDYKESVHNPEGITTRELEVLKLVAKGYTTNQIAELLYTSPRTIETHRQSLLAKTGSANTATLILYAAKLQLIE